MIEKLAILLFDLGLFLFYLIIACIIMKLIDFICLKVFKFDIVKYTCKKIKRISNRIENCFK